MPNTYYIQIFIEEAGTLLSNGGKSKAGHMWFRIYALDEYNSIIKNSIIDAGYATNGIVNDDEEIYLGSPTCESRQLEISQEAYERLKEFANKEESYAQSLGFGINDYNVLSNSCVDYVWKALEIAGYNEKQFEGKLVPMKNCKKIQAIAPNTKSTIFNRNDLFHHFDTILYPSSFYFDFHTIPYKDYLSIDELYGYLKNQIFSFQNKYEQETLKNPTEQELKIILNSVDKNSDALDIDALLHTFPNYLAYPTHSYSTKDSTNSSLALSTPKDALSIHIKAQCFNHKKEALSHREIYVYSPNFYTFVDRAKSDENSFIEFHNACVSSKMTNSDVYFVLNRYGRTGQ